MKFWVLCLALHRQKHQPPKLTYKVWREDTYSAVYSPLLLCLLSYCLLTTAHRDPSLRHPKGMPPQTSRPSWDHFKLWSMHSAEPALVHGFLLLHSFCVYLPTLALFSFPFLVFSWHSLHFDLTLLVCGGDKALGTWTFVFWPCVWQGCFQLLMGIGSLQNQGSCVLGAFNFLWAIDDKLLGDWQVNWDIPWGHDVWRNTTPSQNQEYAWQSQYGPVVRALGSCGFIPREPISLQP